MSIQLSNDEKILKSYKYGDATTGNGLNKTGIEKELIVTNKRIIHRTESHGVGRESVSNRDISLKGINSVQVSYGKKSHVGFMLAAMLFMLLGMLCMVTMKILPVAIGCLLLTSVFVMLYAFVKQYTLTCVITSDARVTPVVAIGIQTKTRGFNSVNNGSDVVVSIKVKKDVAMAMAEELGAVIRNAADAL